MLYNACKIIFESFIFLTLTVDDKEVAIEEAKDKSERSNRLQNHTFSMGNTSSSPWASKPNSFTDNSLNSDMCNKEQYLEMQRNVASDNRRTVQELTGGKIANYNRSSGMIENVSIDLVTF